MIELTIDNRRVQAEPGCTVLQAAARLGIRIPALCHRDGLPPSTSCFVCVVRVQGAPRLLPACSLPAEQGMVVTTDSEEIREARRTALELLLSDHVGDCVAPCTLACPCHLDVPAFIRRLAAADIGGAVEIIRDRLAFPAALGRVCHRPCERVCRRALVDAPVSICALRRFVMERDLAPGGGRRPPRLPDTGKRVAVVGGGPAGLAAAYHLLRQGHQCTVFDAEAEPGGLYRHGIPEFRLPRQVLAAEVEAIRDLGLQWRPGTRLGVDVSLDRLRAEFDGVLLAFGAQRRGPLEVEGEELAGDALELLRLCARGERPDLGEAVIVIGDEETALDAARTARRLGAMTRLLVARKAEAFHGALADRLAEAESEGVDVQLGTRVLRVERAGEGGVRVVALRDGAEQALRATTALAARTRRVDTAFCETLGLAVTEKGILADKETLATSLEGVFAAGEAAGGALEGIRAMASGQSAAVCIDRFLRGQPLSDDRRPIHVSLGQLDEKEVGVLAQGADPAPRRATSKRPARAAEGDWDEVDLGLSEGDAEVEARRCLDCDCGKKEGCALRDLSTECGARPRRFRGERRPLERESTHPDIVYEAGKCIACGACRAIAGAAGEAYGLAFIGRGFRMRTAVPFNRSLADGLRATARECAIVCPTGALTLRRRPPAKPPGPPAT